VLIGGIGLAGVPDDIKRWQEWLTVMDHDYARWLLFIVGLAVFLYLWYRDRKKTPDVILPKEELWKISPGAGRVMARAIMEASTLDEARNLFDAHFASPNPKDTVWAAYALTKRIDAEGEAVFPFLNWLMDQDIDPTAHLEQLDADPMFQ